MSHDKARELLSFWEKQGVLKKSDSDVYSALEKASAPLEQGKFAHLFPSFFFFLFFSLFFFLLTFS